MKDKYLVGESGCEEGERADKHSARRPGGRKRKLDLFSINRGQEVSRRRTVADVGAAISTMHRTSEISNRGVSRINAL